MKKLFSLAALAIAMTFAASASAVVVVNDNFDSYADNAAFLAAWPASTGVGGVLSTGQAQSAPNSVNFGTAALGNRQSFADAALIAVGDQIVFSFDFYDAAPTASPYRQSANLQDTTAPSGTNQLISLGMNNNQLSAESGGQRYMARILGYTPGATDPDGGPNETNNGAAAGASSYFKFNDFGTAGQRSAGWHNLKVILTTDDMLSTDYLFYVDNVLAEQVLNIGAAASIRGYDNIRLGSGNTSTTQAFIDNVYLEYIPVAVPEASSMLAVGLMGIVAGGANWARNRRKAS